jgi:hypothetical protein
VNDWPPRLFAAGGTGKVLVVMKGIKVSGRTGPLDQSLCGSDLGERGYLVSNIYRIPKQLFNRDLSPLRGSLLVNRHGT